MAVGKNRRGRVRRTMMGRKERSFAPLINVSLEELVQPRGNSAGGKGMIEYRAKHREGDCPHALSTSKTASCQPLATGASAADGSAHHECPTTGQARSHHPGSRHRNEHHPHRGTKAGSILKPCDDGAIAGTRRRPVYRQLRPPESQNCSARPSKSS